jgi:TetR/AcrR family transcriptional regulator, transcriptional repressor of bet genes
MGRVSLVEQRREQLLDAFFRCAVREGLHNASIRKIAHEAGVPPSVLHHYFVDREEMIEELVVITAQRHTDNFNNEIVKITDPRTRLEIAVDFLFKPPMINDKSGSLFYDFWSEAQRNERVRQSFAEVYAGFRDTIIELMLEIGLAKGLDPAETNNIASVIIAIYEGTVIQWDLDRENVRLDEIALTTKRMIARYFGLKTREEVMQSTSGNRAGEREPEQS